MEAETQNVTDEQPESNDIEYGSEYNSEEEEEENIDELKGGATIIADYVVAESRDVQIVS